MLMWKHHLLPGNSVNPIKLVKNLTGWAILKPCFLNPGAKWTKTKFPIPHEATDDVQAVVTLCASGVSRTMSSMLERRSLKHAAMSLLQNTVRYKSEISWDVSSRCALCRSIASMIASRAIRCLFGPMFNSASRSCRHIYSTRWNIGTNCILVPPVKPCFTGCWPKDLKHPAGKCNIFPVWIHLSPPTQNVAFQEVFSRHHHLILTASWLLA